ncbi:MAG: ATP-binding cassette domain-containing protein [Puniceicoccales bacterium]|jgi:ABC-type Mn2+/Zn2+ transport system ATPase subunit|nr:ATP-binding cassette domain-containing protein [Puniceicoccales bacterium]
MPPAVLMEEATFGYQGRIVLRGVTLSLPAGAFVAVTGDNGSGKTTFLRTVAGLTPLLGGLFHFVDTELTAQAKAEAENAEQPLFAIKPRIGFVSQRDKLDDLYLFTAYEVVCAGARLAMSPGAPVGAGTRMRVWEALERVGGTELAHLPFAKLSGGQRQRVLFARALALEPEVLVLDEPVSGADAGTLERVTAFLENLRAEGQMTVFLASHDATLVARLATCRLHLSNAEVACEFLARASGEETGGLSHD